MSWARRFIVHGLRLDACIHDLAITTSLGVALSLFDFYKMGCS